MIFGRKKLGGFYYSKDYPKRFIQLIRFKFKLKAIWRWLHVQKFMWTVLGFQYEPSTDLIEIDITYLCNLRCKNCNRSSAQAPAAEHISFDRIRNFVADSITQNRYWRRIRILGGEPTLHPNFQEILTELLKLKKDNRVKQIQVVTNGFGPKVDSILTTLPAGIEVENSAKQGNVQPEFGPFNKAPCDSGIYRLTDFRHGCDIIHSCGMGLTPRGYYPCAVAGGIDRVTDAGIGRLHLPAAGDDMRDLLSRNCRLCGRFRDGHYVPEKLRKRLLTQITSSSWHSIYSRWQENNKTGSKNGNDS